MVYFPRCLIFLFGFSSGFMISLLLMQDSYELRIKCSRLLLNTHHNSPEFMDGVKLVNKDQVGVFLNNSMEKLYETQRILCVVMTHSSTQNTRATAVRDTWGRHCNTLLFMSNTFDPRVPTIDTGVRRVEKGVWRMTFFALKYVQQNYANAFDWIFKCDDDTYAIIENMATFLSNYSSTKPSYFGFHIKHPIQYMSGGAGYVISKETLRIFIEQSLNGTVKECSENVFEPEDVVMGRCMRALGVKFEDSRDAWGRQRFFTEPVESHTFPNNDFNFKSEPLRWYRYASLHPTQFGLNCCSVAPISFHHVTPHQMYALEYLTYLTERPSNKILKP